MMSDHASAASIEIQVAGPFKPLVDEVLIEAAILAALQESPPPPPIALTLVVTDDAEIQELNRTYRGIDAPTDVLSFEIGEDPYRPEGEPVYLGDVIISYPRCSQQAQEVGHPVWREMCLLAIHGVLHLLGYDHATEQDEREMWRLQEHALAQLTGQGTPSCGQEV